MTPETVPVVIVGGGPTGITAAIMLARRGVRCLVLERHPEICPLPRAVHFDDEVFRILAGLGLEEQVRAISTPMPGMRLTDERHRVLAEFRRDPARQVHGFPQSNMFDQPELERVLRSAFAGYDCLELRGGVEVFAIEQHADGPGAVRVRFREVDSGAEHEVWADAVLGCDGAKSGTRDVVGATMEDFDFAQRWHVVDVDSPDRIHVYDGVQQVCHPEHAATFMPVVPGRYRWEFRLPEGEDPDEARIRELIQPWLDASGADPDKITFVRHSAYVFRGLVADRWRRGRVFLLGDAAHQTPPFIGQGLCAGLRDAQNLTWKLALVLDGTASDDILDTYEAERRPHARRVVQLAIGIGWIMTGGSRRTAPLRRAALRLLTGLPGVEDRVLNSAWPAFADGQLVHRPNRACPAGRLCGQPTVRGEAGETRLDRLLGDRFAVLYRGADRVAAFDPPTRQFFDSLGTRIVRLEDVADDGGALERLLDELEADALLLRPDRVIAAAADSPELRGWRRHLEAAGIGSKGQ